MKYQILKARTMLAHAQDLVYTLKELMPTPYQKDNLDAMLGLFLEAQGHPLPEHSQTKSPSALSRFLNVNPWSTRDMKRNCSPPCSRDGFKGFISTITLDADHFYRSSLT